MYILQKGGTKEMKKQVEGITLIALIITIIILLILAGITIGLVVEDNGIIIKAQQGKKDYTKAQLKEEIELKIVDDQTEKIVKGEDFTYKDLERLSEIGVELENTDIPMIGEYKGYGVTIDENYVVTIGDKVIGAKPTMTLTKNTEEPANTITIKVEASIEEGNITLITKPDGTTTTETAFDYIVTENGVYSFIAQGSSGRRTVKKITIKNAKPKEPIIEISGGEYLILSVEAKVEEKKVKITYEENENLNHYYSEDRGTTWQEYKGEFTPKTSLVKAKSVHKENENCYTASQKATIEGDALGPEVLDGDIGTDFGFTYQPGGGTSWRFLQVDPSCYGRKFNVTAYYGSWSHHGYGFQDENGEWINTITAVNLNGNNGDWYGTYEITIPEGTKKLGFFCDCNSTTWHVHYSWIREVALKEDD